MRSTSCLGRRAVLGAALAVPAGAHAQTWPTRPIRMIVPGPAGGALDLAARAIGDVVQRELGQSLLVDPRPGASGVVGAQALLAAPADGHTFYLTVSSHVVLPFVIKVPFDVIADFEPIAMIGNGTSLVCVPPSLPVGSIAGFVAYARANPGGLNYLNTGKGTSTHLTTELLKRKFGVDMTSVQYRGAPPGLVDLLRGHIQFGVVTTGLALSHVLAGNLKAIAYTGTTRLAELPAVATLLEQDAGDIDIPSLVPVYGRRGLVAPVIARFNAAINAALADPASVKRLDQLHIQITPMTPVAVGETMREEHQRLAGVVRQLGITPDEGSN